MAKGKIDYDTVVAATGGDALAAGAVLDYFNDFMDGLCTGFYTDAEDVYKRQDGKRVSVHVCSFPSRTAACNPYAA